MDFVGFPKIHRVSRPCIITEKIDGTNGQICITEDGEFLVGSRTRWITPDNDNHGFARWAYENKEELLRLGVGHHFGEWWGKGIQRKYNLNEKRFSLFNTSIWSDDSVRPACCHVVPVIFEGLFSSYNIDCCLGGLETGGSVASPGFMNPEGIVCYHIQGGFSLKKTLGNDGLPKSLVRSGEILSLGK